LKKPRNINAFVGVLVDIYLSCHLFFSTNGTDPKFDLVSDYFKNIDSRKRATSEVIKYFNRFGLELNERTVDDILKWRKQFKLKFEKVPDHF
jgi:hypothetical protein